jgi:hypothetical protein
MYEHLLSQLVVPDYAPEDLLAVTMDYLETGGPREWHEVAQNWVWDAGWVPLKWIIDQDDADQATILTLFWYTSPEYALFHEANIGSTDDGFLFSLYILTRWKSGVYTRQEFCFPGIGDGGTDNVHFTNMRLQAHERSKGVPGLEIPMSMVTALPGLAIPKGNETFLFDRRV